ncbi:MAG: DR2241 family protein [Verrucomicrobiota bacterium JB025]|nr:DR2241 family protein [Verrucomicrobiota bacterium JB025]
MSIASKLDALIQSGIRRIGELMIQADASNGNFVLSHHQDAELVHQASHGGLELHTSAASARAISTYSDDGTYRFAKAQCNLIRGWVMVLETPEELLQALDIFYPAAVGLHLARRDGQLDVQHLRDKLERQTGMYRFTRTITDEDAQSLVQSVCGPAHQCAKRILWQLDADTPLDDSEASRFNGIPTAGPKNEAIPLLCREACNHFVAECRRLVKQRNQR